MSNPFYLCEVPTDYYSNQIKSNQIKSNQIKSRKDMTWLDLSPTMTFLQINLLPNSSPSGLKTWGSG